MMSLDEYDVAVIGSGPAGSCLAWALGEREGLKVALIDPSVDDENAWRNNYGSWSDEWEALRLRMPELELEDCVSHSWKTTDCFFGGSWGVPESDKVKLDRGYVRVDRKALWRKIFEKSNVRRVRGSVDARASIDCRNIFDKDVIHDAKGTTLTVTTLDSTLSLRTSLVVDCTGFESHLTTRRGDWDKPATELPGYQIAYGFEVDVKDYAKSYDPEAMLLFDYRDSHLFEGNKKDPPTFMYAMPLGPGKSPNSLRVFFEETVLVSRPALSVAECKRRADLRLKKLEIHEVSEHEDVELCYIPMGGPLPDRQQRIVAFGAAANLVHPSTGYQLCRALCATTDLSSAIGAALKADKSPDAVAKSAYAALWSKKTALQRDFAIFGGEFLLQLNAVDLRGWFSAFFELNQETWAGFLAGWPGLPGNIKHETRLERLLFGLDMFRRLPPPVALKLTAFLLSFSFTQGDALLRSVTPFFGDGPGVNDDGLDIDFPIEDADVKREIMAILAAASSSSSRSDDNKGDTRTTPVVDTIPAMALSSAE